ncbi:MAG: metal dependent phosphohydrolase [Acidobacteria bacterium]|nr:metal dependent phosphohydrolase [Acidobacteriota bacterium]
MQKAARRIVERLRLHGHEAFFAGGWVRDFLLRRKAQDIDIATSALPEQVAAIFPNSTLIGAEFGVVQVRMYGRAYEVTTFRSEGPYLDGRHPSAVVFSGPMQDVQRRDFTINGLFYDPSTGRIIDYIHGKTDLQRKIIRTIGDPYKRFSEDKLRMMRAVRLAAALDFGIASDTWKAIQGLSAQILQVSWERIRDEIVKTLTGPRRDKGLDLLREGGLMEQILPEVTAMVGIAQPAEFHPEGDVYSHTKAALGLLHKPSPTLALGTLLHDVGKPPTFSVKERIRFDGHVELGGKMAVEICRRLRMSNDEIAAIAELVIHHLRFMNVKEMRLSTLKKFLRLPNFADHLELHRVDCLSSHRDLESYYFCLEKLEEFGHEPAPATPLINGRDLIDLGYKPGPVFAKILQSVEDLQLEGTIDSRDEALEYIKKWYPLPEKQLAKPENP